jgi:hypothetical protein
MFVTHPRAGTAPEGTTTHQVLAAEAAVAAHHDAHVRPVAADVGHDPRQVLEQPGRGVDVRGPQQG